MRPAILTVLRGFAMGSADLVPGVSGGTIALVLGIYRRLVGSIRAGSAALGSLLRWDTRGLATRLKEVDWGFLFPLLLGIAVAIVSLSRLIAHLLEVAPLRMAALFFGLVTASVVVAWRLIRQPAASTVGLALVVAVITFWLLGYSAGPVDDPRWWMFLGAGAVAICAMILPGISGSFVLLMLGMYEATLGALNQRDFASIALVAAGAVAGLAGFSTLLHRLLDRYHDTVMAALVGLMAGSLRVLWPWPDGTAGTTLSRPSGDVALPVLLALGGAVLVLAITRREQEIETEVDAAAEAAE